MAATLAMPTAWPQAGVLMALLCHPSIPSVW